MVDLADFIHNPCGTVTPALVKANSYTIDADLRDFGPDTMIKQTGPDAISSLHTLCREDCQMSLPTASTYLVVEFWNFFDAEAVRGPGIEVLVELSHDNHVIGVGLNCPCFGCVPLTVAYPSERLAWQPTSCPMWRPPLVDEVRLVANVATRRLAFHGEHVFHERVEVTNRLTVVS